MTLDSYIEYLQEIRKLHGGSTFVYSHDFSSTVLGAAKLARPPIVTNLKVKSSRESVTKFIVNVADELGERVVKLN